jgi:hypothetical protein
VGNPGDDDATERLSRAPDCRPTSTGQPLCIGQTCTGALSSFGTGQYTGSFFSQANPESITVKSNLGASATAAVTAVK